MITMVGYLVETFFFSLSLEVVFYDFQNYCCALCLHQSHSGRVASLDTFMWIQRKKQNVGDAKIYIWISFLYSPIYYYASHVS